MSAGSRFLSGPRPRGSGVPLAAAALCLALTAAVAGCGGGGGDAGGAQDNVLPGRTLAAGTDTRKDGRLVDYFRVTAARSGVTEVRVRASDFDPYLTVHAGNGGFVAQSGASVPVGPADAPEGRVAVASFYVTGGESFYVGVSGRAAGETGRYDLTAAGGLGVPVAARGYFAARDIEPQTPPPGQ